MTETTPAPRTLNKHKSGVPAGAVYVGRPSKWGNPFEIGRDGNRAEVIAKHREWIKSQPQLLAALSEIRGKNLVCFCAPCPCHADTLREMANA